MGELESGQIKLIINHATALSVDKRLNQLEHLKKLKTLVESAIITLE